MDGKGREGTYNFFLTTTGRTAGEGQGIGHRRQLPPPLPPRWRRPCKRMSEGIGYHGRHQDFWVRGQRGGKAEPIGEQKKIVVIGLSTEEN